MRTTERRIASDMQIQAGVITISDRASKGLYDDLGGPALKEAAEGYRWKVLAESLVPDEMVLRTNLLGTEAMVRDRIRAYREAGITTLRLQPEGATPRERLDTLGRAVELVKQVSAEAVPA